MSKVRHNVTLNILIPGLIPEISLTELDTGHQICFHIAGMDLTGYTARIWVEKPSSLRVYNDCIVDGRCVIADITNQMLAEKGRCKGQIKLVSTTDGLVTPGDFIFNVKCDLSGDGLESKNESTVFENMMADIMENMGIDATLTKTGYAADAAAVGEKFRQVSEQIGNQTGTGLSTEAIDKLEEVGNHLAFISADGGSKWTELIAILRGSSGGETEVTLSSISATYSGGSVLVGTSVNALTGIVVTAKYSDGSTKTVTGYTLSGTILEGSNTVTISYGGKSTTITVIGYAEDEPEVTLTSITASYTGGDVTVGTALTDLTGITVTGHYSDGSTGAITGYTLSGEIVEGSNTITVSYGGKTTTFTVTGVAESGSGEDDTSDGTEWTDGVPYEYTLVANEYAGTLKNDDNGIKEYTGWSRTPFLPCKGASSITVTYIDNTNSSLKLQSAYGVWYDADKKYIKSFNQSTANLSNVPTEAYFVILSQSDAIMNNIASITPHA